MAGPINQKRQMRVETVPLATLRLDPGNANIHDDEDVDSIAAKLAQFGQVEPLVVQSGTHRVIGGNGRLMAMVKLGWAECAVTYVDVDDDQAAALGVALNTRSSRLDDERLSRIIEQIRRASIPMRAVGLRDHKVRQLVDRANAASMTSGAAAADAEKTKRVRAVVPLAILLTRAQVEAWENRKDDLGVSGDTEAFLIVAEIQP